MLILRAFTLDQTRLSFTDLQVHTGLPRATLHRIAGDLVQVGLLDRDEGRYRLAGFVFELGMRASVERRLLEVAAPFLEELREKTQETVHLGIREGVEVVYIAKVGGRHQVQSPSRLGGRMPLHATAIGKVLLAHAGAELRNHVLAGPLERLTPRTITTPQVLADQLRTAVHDTVAYEYEESATGIVCVAAGVRGRDGTTVAAISVTGPVTRFHPRRFAASVEVTAAGIAASLALGSSLRD